MLRAKVPPRTAIMLTLLGLIFGIVLSSSQPAVRAEVGRFSDPSVIRITPSAPVIDDHARLSELANRREHVAKAIGPKAMLVLFSAEPRLYTNDVDYRY